MIDSAPQVMRFPVDPHKDLGQMPAPRAPIEMIGDTLFPDLCCEQRPKAVLPETYCFMTDVNASFMKQVFDLT